MLFLAQVCLAQIEIVRFYGKIVSSLPFKVLCGMIALPFLAIFILSQLPIVVFGLFLMGVGFIGFLAYLIIDDLVRNRSVAIVEHPVGKPVPSVEWMIADFELTIDNMIADAQWEVTKFITVRQYETFNPFDGSTSLSPETWWWVDRRDIQPVQQILFHEDDLIETSVDIAVLPKRELFALAKSHGLKVSGKGRTLNVIRQELFKVMYGK